MNTRSDNSRFRTTWSRKSDRITHLSHRNGMDLASKTHNTWQICNSSSFPHSFPVRDQRFPD